MQRHREIGPREAAEQAVVEHRPGPCPAFLGRLADEHERARPLVAMLGQIAGDADQVRHVHVVAAGVHHADRRAAFVLRAHFRRVRQAGFLGDGQRIQIGPQHQRLARAVLQHADDAVAADVRSSP